jgi:rhodanese-related sulfurtransferase
MKKRKHAETIYSSPLENKENNNSNNCHFDLNKFLNKSSSKCQEAATSLNLNRVKRLRLNSLSPNTVNANNTSSYSSMLASAARSLITKPATPQFPPRNKLFTKFEHLNENSSSLDSGIGGNNNNCFSPASFEIQLINASNTASQQQQQQHQAQQRPSINYDFSDESTDTYSISDSNSNQDEITDYSQFFEDTINLGCDEETQHGSARRCLFKSSPTTPSSTSKSSSLTPISCLRPNLIIQEESPYCMSALFDYSLNSIEKSLQIFAQKRQEPAARGLDCIAENHELIKTSLDNEYNASSETTSRLIGDRSRFHLLPCITSIKHNDLNVIAPQTLTQLLDGKYSDQFDELIVIDSRYPYEYDGGHIRRAKNIYTKEKLVELFLDNVVETKDKQRTLIIFHCEFSSERGPNLLRFLRNQDRAAHRDVYPALHYPELYLLEGGYKAFYELHQEYCEPKMYKPMLHVDHVQDLKHFRAKTKTWEYSLKHNATTATGFKSRIMSKSKTMDPMCMGRLQRFPKSTLF